MTTTTPDMNLVLPDVSITAGPQWATLLNAALTLIDSHDHSTGKGLQVTPSGLNISSDLTFASNNATNLRSLRFFNNLSFTPGASDKTCLYALNGELFYIDAAGNNVQVTLNGAVDVSGSITSLTIKDTAFFIENFSDNTKQFRFDVSAIPTGTTRILSVPDSGGNTSFVTAAATQTLTNKTLTSPVIAAINTGSVTFTLPAADGSNGQAIATNGSGTLSFVTPGAIFANIAANDSNVVFTNSSSRYQVCFPTANRTYTLPTTSILAGDIWEFNNQSNFFITVQSSGSNTVDYVVGGGTLKLVALVNSPTTAANWRTIEAHSRWSAFTPTLSAGWGTTSSLNFFYRRQGNSCIIRGTFVLGTTAGSVGTMTLPGGFSLDTAWINATAFKSAFGVYTRLTAASAGIFSTDVGGVWTYNGTASVLQFAAKTDAAGGLYASVNVNGEWSSGDTCTIVQLDVPISGWGG